MAVAGLLLAAGAGRRFGGPKALARIDGEPMVRRALRVLGEGGCSPVCVVLGAQADDVRAELPTGVRIAEATDWETGMGASLRAGLEALGTLSPAPGAALVHLVDLPGVPADAVRRVGAFASPDALARAGYDGVPGHPVLLGSSWWSEIAASVSGDRGARDWLRGREDLRLVECGDLGTGGDVDAPEDLAAVRSRNPYAHGCDGS